MKGVLPDKFLFLFFSRYHKCCRTDPGIRTNKDLKGGILAVFVLIPAMVLFQPGTTHAGLALVETLSFMQQLEPEHLIPPHVITVSPDGRHLYAGSDLSLAVFQRDAATGALQLVEIEAEAKWGARDLVMSPDGRHLYAAGLKTLQVFRREGETGLLQAVEVSGNGANGMDARFGNHSLGVSPDGRSLYVYATMGVFSAETGSNESVSAVGVFSLDAGNGGLQFVEMERIGFEKGNSTGSHVEALIVSPDGRNVYVSGEGDNAIAAFKRDIITGELEFLEIHKDGVNGVEGLKFVQSLSVSPDGKNLYASGLYGCEIGRSGCKSGTVVVFNRDADSGALTFEEMVKNGSSGVAGLFDVQSVALSPDGDSLYVGVDGGTITGSAADFEPAAVLVFHRDTATGTLHFKEVHQNKAHGADDLIGIESLVVSPDGRNLYTAGPAQSDPFTQNPPQRGTIGVFNRNESNGALDFGQAVTHESRLSGAEAMVISPDGKHLYAAGPGNNELSAFYRDEGTGSLRYLKKEQNVIHGAKPYYRIPSLAMSPDGRNLYAAADHGGNIAAFRRNIASGDLSILEVQELGVGNLENLHGIRAMVISPDGRHLYAVDSEFSTETFGVIFRRDSTTGALTNSKRWEIEIPGLEDYNSVQSLAASPDGRFLYAVLSNNESVAAFSRDMETGDLEFTERHQNVLGYQDHYYLDAMAISPDGRHLYVSGASYGYTRKGVAVFGIHPETGGLSLLEVHQDILEDSSFDDHEMFSIQGLAMAASGDGRFLFIGETGYWGSGYGDINRTNAIAMFMRDTATGKLHRIRPLTETFLPGGQSLNISPILLSPDHQHLYLGDTLGILIYGWDTDNDGTPDANDACPSDPGKSAPGICGCGVPDTDTDGDGVMDCLDACPLDPGDWIDTDQDGVGDNADEDDDGDGVKDVDDAFPLDPAESLDTDQDGMGDNVDDDDDGDNIPDIVEDSAHAGGDGNGDGIPDSVQANVASLFTDDGAHAVTLESDPGTRLGSCMAAAAPFPGDDEIAGLDFPYGLFSFTMDGVGTGTVKLHLPDDASVSTYYKYGRTPENAADHWYEFLFDGETGARMPSGDADDPGSAGIIVLHLEDGRRGDDILRPDNRIVDLGGPAIPAESGGSSDCPGCGGGSGCFISILPH